MKIELNLSENFTLGMTIAIAVCARRDALQRCMDMGLDADVARLARDIVQIERLSNMIYGLPFPTIDGN